MPIPGVVASGRTTSAVSAVRFNGAGNHYSRANTSFPTGNWTVAFWLKLASDLNHQGTAVGVEQSGGATYTYVSPNSTGTTLARITNGGDAAGEDMTVGTWYYVAAVQSSTAGSRGLYSVAAPATTLNSIVLGANAVQNATNNMYIGGYTADTTYRIDGSIACVRFWSTALTKAQLETELPKKVAQLTSGLWAEYRFTSGPQTTDDSGNARTLTATGTPTTDASGPPVT